MNKRRIEELLTEEIKAYGSHIAETFDTCLRYDAQCFISELIDIGFVYQDKNSITLGYTAKNTDIESFISDYYFNRIAYLEATEEAFAV